MNSINDPKKIHEIKVVKKILNANDIIANGIREKFRKYDTFVINIMSSPGSGKTTLLQKILKSIMLDLKCSIIVGDICTTNDACRLLETGADVVQINTDEFGGDCHLSASTIEKALESINLKETDLLIIENIGNLVCPAEFDIGENIKIAVLSVTEGEDKPAKYPLMFRKCDAVILNKIDLLPYLDYDISLTEKTIHSINSQVPIFKVSAKTQEGLKDLITWVKETVSKN